MFPWRNPGTVQRARAFLEYLRRPRLAGWFWFAVYWFWFVIFSLFLISVIHGWPADFDLSYLDFLDLRHPWLGDCSSLPDVSLLQLLLSPSCPRFVRISSPSPVKICPSLVRISSPNPVRRSRKIRLSAPLNPHLQHHSHLVSRVTIILHSIP